MSRILPLALLGLFMIAAPSHAGSADDLKTANQYYKEQSYALAAQALAPLLDEKANDATAREVRFKWGDSILKGKDPAQGEKAVKLLQELTETNDHDRWWAESGVTLAQHYIEKDPYGKMPDIKKFMDDARDFWAGSDDVVLARERFIAISFALADFVTQRWGWYVNDLRPIRLDRKTTTEPPQENGASLRMLFEEVLKVAKSDKDKAQAHFGIAMAMMQTYSAEPKHIAAVRQHFETVIREYPATEWADDAAYQLGMYAENRSDFILAVQAYRNLIASYRTGESSWLDEAKNRLDYLTKPSLQLSVGGTFVTGSEIQFGASWRNLKQAEATLYKLDMVESLGVQDTGVRDSAGQQQRIGYSSYQEMLRQLVEQDGRYRSLAVQQRWTLQLEDEGNYKPYSAHKGLAEWRMEQKNGDINPKLGVLPPGAYLLVATASGLKPAYELVLVTDLALVSKIGNRQAVLLSMDAKTGKPQAGTTVKYIYSWYDERGYTQWAEGSGKSDENGLLSLTLHHNEGRQYSSYRQHQFFATAAAGANQAFIQNSYYHNDGNNKGEWWLYAFSDRPAYRPNETVSFKGILRRYDGGLFSNSPGQKIKARIYDARGNQVKEANYTLNDFGSFDDTLTLDDKATLGEYRLELYTADQSTHLATARLFRLEEYKLPEYQVKIATKSQAKDDKTAVSGFRLGDTVTVEVEASYYFGGAVANAQVEYLVYQQPYYFTYQPVRSYGWYYADMVPQNNFYGRGTLLTQKTITADAEGKARFTIPTSKDPSADLQFRIEVRVVDQSRREIRATQNIKVTKNAYFAVLEPKQNLYRPGDKVGVTIRTMTPNTEPVAVDGKVTVRRNWWRLPMQTKDGTQPTGGYDGQEMFSKFVKTNERGEALFEFEPSEDGYYIVEFTSFDNGNPVTAQTSLFVGKDSSTNIGYQYSGLQIITEKDTYQEGETLRAMIVTDKPDSWVLLSQEGDELYSHVMLHLTGSVKLIELPVTAQLTPNFFFAALSGDRYQLKTAATQIIVPPAKKFLNVAVTSDKSVYKPQEEGTFTLKVTDQNGKPVSAEIALGLTDAAVYGIQEEMASDIQQFFYGTKRQQSIQTQASFYQRPYLNLVRDDGKALITDTERNRQRADTDSANGLKKQDRVAQDKNFRGGEMDEMRQTGASNMVGGMRRNEAPAALASPMVSEKSVAFEEGLLKESVVGKSELKRKISGDLRDSKDSADGEAIAELGHVRNDFRSTVIWQPSVKTATDGTASLKVKYPDSLTTWRFTARANTPDTAVGSMTHEVRSNKELMVRLQAPRFFTERDLTVVSALIDNMSNQVMTVNPRLKTTGLTVTGLYQNGQFVKGEMTSVEVPANGQKRVDWAVSANQAGAATIKVSALSDKNGLADAMEKTYPVIPHGIEKFIAQSLVLRSGDDSEQVAALNLTIPKERIKESTSLRLTVSPSLAANLLDALPYLADFPYGCVEQTLSRFLPAVIVAKTMRDLGISPQDTETYINDVLTPRGDPQGQPQRRTDMTLSRLQNMTRDGLKRLEDFQHSDGGWGWWKEGDSDRFMTAYVVWGLSLAREAGLEVKTNVLDRAVNFLQLQLVQEEKAPDMLAWMLHSLAQAQSDSEFETTQRDRLWAMRDKLNPYTRALFALAEHRRGITSRSTVLAQNLINGIDEDKENGTAHWGEAGIHYRWSDGGVEATAFVVKALAQIAPHSPQLEPAVKWLALNRRGASWKNTRDTAIAILGLSEYLKATGELAPDYTYEVFVNGKAVRSGQVSAANVFTFGRSIEVPSDNLRDGTNSVKVLLKGRGALYLSAHAKYFTLEEGISKAGNEVFVTRQYYKQSTKETLMKGLTQDWTPIKDGDAVNSGDRIRVDITLDAKNHYEYLIAEDYRPAGLEALELKSGAGASITLDRQGRETEERPFLYQEFRDQKAAFFLDQIKQGKHLIRYELRAEVPGIFHAMPNQTHAMYVPEIRANSDEMRITINETTTAKP